MDLRESIKAYYKGLNKHRNLYMESELIEGHFSYEKLEIGINGASEVYRRLSNLPTVMKKEMDLADDAYLRVSISEIVNMSEPFKLGLEYIQILYHEALHVLQTLTLTACNEHIYWERNFTFLEFEVLRHHIHLGYVWNKKETIISGNVFNWINADGDYVKKQLRNYSFLRGRIQDNFVYRKASPLSTLDLVEGQAYAFQELVTDAIGRFSHHLSPDSKYKKAFHYFLPNMPLNIEQRHDLYTIFILICHLSLRFGTARYGENIRTAVSIFQYLCTNKAFYVMQYNRSSSSENISKYQQWLQEHDYDIVLNLNTTNFIKNAALIDLIEKDILEYYRTRIFDKTFFLTKEAEFYNHTIVHHDDKMKALNAFYKSHIKGFDSKYFIAALLTGNTTILPNYLMCVLDKRIDALPMETAYGNEITVAQDSNIFQIFSDFKTLLEHGKTYCCSQHGETEDTTILFNCTEKDAFRILLKKLFGDRIELERLIK